jgi:WD40 repeat protein
VSYADRSIWLGDRTIVEEIRTGQRVATLPGVDAVEVAPGGRTAVSEKTPIDRVGEPSWLILWDLETLTPRAELTLPDCPDRVEFSPDGRFVFARPFSFSRLIRWWDVQTGQQVGQFRNPRDVFLVDSGRILIDYSSEDHIVHYWDVVTGMELAEWELSPRTGESGSLGNMERSASERHLLVDFDPGRGQKPARSFRTMDRVLEWIDEHFPDGPEREERRQILILDAIERRELGTVPGRSAAVSENGEWVATIDADGLVRVWRLPLGRPWARAAAYAAALVYGSWLILMLLGKLWWRWKRDAAQPKSQRKPVGHDAESWVRGGGPWRGGGG